MGKRDILDMDIKFRFKQDTRYLNGKRDILGPHIAEICVALPFICCHVNRTIQPKGKRQGKAIPVEAWTGPEGYRIFFPHCHHMYLWTSWSSLLGMAAVELTSEVGTPMRRSYVVPMM
jgi:hypothetical protein